MITLTVPDMTCGHCVSTLTKAIKSIDPTADVKADLASKTLRIETTAPAPRIARALDEAGYSSNPA
ncbi:heavy-metal-associated domain-containing protein [Aestuariivirga sp.]|uniref:heavy-metal-associated domain-containing protein n=1 Tax=Aestuariivirga sp. TaxID=2650926 RepID=UPI00391D0831